MIIDITYHSGPCYVESHGLIETEVEWLLKNADHVLLVLNDADKYSQYVRKFTRAPKRDKYIFAVTLQITGDGRLFTAKDVEHLRTEPHGR